MNAADVAGAVVVMLLEILLLFLLNFTAAAAFVAAADFPGIEAISEDTLVAAAAFLMLL